MAVPIIYKFLTWHSVFHGILHRLLFFPKFHDNKEFLMHHHLQAHSGTTWASYPACIGNKIGKERK
jgi:hypothetical protein